MNSNPWTGSRSVATACALWLALVGFARPLFAAENGGTISGAVSNVATGKLLEGARVEIPALGRVALADETGRYLLDGVPPGTHELVASYAGLDAAKFTVTVGAG